MTSKHFAD
jgi:hypothetical protein